MADQMILADRLSVSLDCSQTGCNNNMAVIGTSGSGKTKSLVEPRLLTMMEGSLIVPISKRLLIRRYRESLRKREYHVMELNLADPSQSTCGFDPLQYVHSCRDITNLAASLVLGGGETCAKSSDPYWDHAAISLLSAEIALLLQVHENPSFAQLLDLQKALRIYEDSSSSLVQTNLDSIFEKLPEDSFAVQCWKTFRQLPIKTASCIYSTLNTQLDTLFTPEICGLMKKQTIDFRALASMKTVLFVTTSPVNLTLQNLVTLFYSTAFRELFEFAQSREDEQLPVPVQVICDDLGVGGKIVNLDRYISVFRAAGISAVLLLQSESQLIGAYGQQEAATILNNCDTMIYTGGNDLTSAKDVSLRYNRPLEEVLYLPVGEFLLFRRGTMPRRCRRYPILEDPRYQQLYSEIKDRETP